MTVAPYGLGTITLEHLFVRPKGGIGNRLRAVAAAKRLCSLTGARGSIVWPEGNYNHLLAADPALDVVVEEPCGPDVCRLTLPYFVEGGNQESWVVPVSEDAVVFVHTGFFFGAKEEPVVRVEEVVGDWLPHPAEAVTDRVRAFAAKRFDRTVGMHIRQGDNGRHLVAPPVELFVAEAERLVDEGHSIFLATDNVHTETALRLRFGSRVLVSPKNWRLPHRWPRDGKSQMHETDEIVMDLVDLLLLAACDYVVGWEKSSFSKVAAAYNGSPRCVLFAGPALDPLGGRYRRTDPGVQAKLRTGPGA